MKRFNKNNPYGYKVGYEDNDSRLFVCCFKDRTYLEAVKTATLFRQYRDNSRKWIIKPIKLTEYARGIWKDIPF